MFSHHCDKECQKKDRKTHQGRCTHWLLKDIAKKKHELQMLEADSNCSARDMAAKQEGLADHHKLVGKLLRCTMLLSNYLLAEENFRQSMKLHRKLVARAKRRGLLADEGIFVDNSIGTLMDLGQLFSQWYKLDQAMQACEDALEAMRDNMSVHGIAPLRQETLAEILTAKGETHNEQYERQGRGTDKSKCMDAQTLGEEALAIQRALRAQEDGLALDLTARSQPDHPLNPAHRQARTAEVLLEVSRTYMHLEKFDRARSTVQEALDLSILCFGKESEKAAGCHSLVANICNRRAIAIRKGMGQSSSCYSPGTRVLVEGLQSQPQYNGLTGVVLRLEDSRLCVRLDQDNMDLRVKLQNVSPLVATADERKKLLAQVQSLALEQIESSKEFLRLQVKVKGVKHVNTALAHYGLGLTLLDIYKPGQSQGRQAF